MPASEIRDLDVLLPQPIRVKLGGREYLVPGDIPAPTFLRLQELAQEADAEGADSADNLAVMRELYEMLLDLFRVHQPDVEELPIGLGQMVAAVGQIYGGQAAPPTTPPSSGTRTTRPRVGPTRKSPSSPSLPS